MSIVMHTLLVYYPGMISKDIMQKDGSCNISKMRPMMKVRQSRPTIHMHDNAKGASLTNQYDQTLIDHSSNFTARKQIDIGHTMVITMQQYFYDDA
jgi:hypothetical protein